MSDKSNGVPSPVEFFNWLNSFVQPVVDATTQAAAQSPLPPVPGMVNPFQMWKSMTDYNEQAWSQFFKQVVSTPEFAAGLGRGATQGAVAREGIRRVSKAYLEAANMPSRDDHIRLASQVVMLDAKLDDVEDMLKDADLAKITQRLDAIIVRLDNLEQASLTPAPAPTIPGLNILEGQLTTLNARLDRLSNLEDRLSQLEARLAAVSTTTPHATPAKTTSKSLTATASKKPASVEPAAPKVRPARRKTTPANNE